MSKQVKSKHLRLPPVMPFETDAVVDLLMSLEHSQRKPLATARLLVLAVKLYLVVAISQRRAQGLITVQIQTEMGKVKNRQSVVTHKYIEPCDRLVDAVKNANVKSVLC